MTDIASSVQALHEPLVALQPKAQIVSEPHWPFAPQVCAVLPLQRCAPGAQTPPQRPDVASQMLGHAEAAAYVPSARQCRDDGPVAQTSVPGTHSPAPVSYTHLTLPTILRV